MAVSVKRRPHLLRQPRQGYVFRVQLPIFVLKMVHSSSSLSESRELQGFHKLLATGLLGGFGGPLTPQPMVMQAIPTIRMLTSKILFIILNPQVFFFQPESGP